MGASRAAAAAVLDDLGQARCLLDPSGNGRLGGHAADGIRSGRIGLLERLGEMCRIALRQLGCPDPVEFS
jgi:hypothetical protein